MVEKVSALQWCHMNIMASQINDHSAIRSAAFKAENKENIKALYY